MGEGEEVERARDRERTPAGLEADGRDEALMRPPEVHAMLGSEGDLPGPAPPRCACR